MDSTTLELDHVVGVVPVHWFTQMFSRRKYRLSFAEQLENIAFAVVSRNLCLNASDLAS